MATRIIVGLCGVLWAMIAFGCSGAHQTDRPAAQSVAQSVATDFQVASPKFTEFRPRKRIPIENTCYGENLSPPLEWSGAPEGTESYGLIAEDIDHQTGAWVHWVLYIIPRGVTALPEGIPSSMAVLPDGTIQGTNDNRQPGYSGACPPPSILYRDEQAKNEPTHRYYFTLYALDSEVTLAPGATKAELLEAMEGHILARAETVGKYRPPPMKEFQQDLETTTDAGASTTLTP